MRIELRVHSLFGVGGPQASVGILAADPEHVCFIDHEEMVEANSHLVDHNIFRYLVGQTVPDMIIVSVLLVEPLSNHLDHTGLLQYHRDILAAPNHLYPLVGLVLRFLQSFVYFFRIVLISAAAKSL